MNNSGLKLLLTLLISVIAVSGYFITTALDRLRSSNYALADALKEFKKTQTAPYIPPQAAAVPAVKKAVESNIANKDFYTSDAVPGGRMIQATEAAINKVLKPITFCNISYVGNCFGKSITSGVFFRS